MVGLRLEPYQGNWGDSRRRGSPYNHLKPLTIKPQAKIYKRNIYFLGTIVARAFCSLITVGQH